MTRDLLFIENISVQADTFYKDAEHFGAWASEAFGSRSRSQLTSLENIANSTRKVSDVKDYIKKQTARREPWQNRSGQGMFGKTLLKFIEDDLEGKAQTVCNSIEAETKTGASELEKQQTHLALIREFVRQVVAHYEYSTLQGGVLDT